jgi:phosphoglycerate dehydrogenase-like enzyme
MPRVVLDMNDRRPIWAMPGWVPDGIREVLPPEWALEVMGDVTDGSGDGAGRVAPALLAAVADAEIYFGYGVAPELLGAGSRLRWVHSGAAGVGSSLTPEMRARDVIFTNSAGIHAVPMAETVLGMILYFSRGFDFAVSGKAKGRWSSEPYYAAGAPLRELSETTVGLVGFGGIGREIARRVASLGARVVAVKRRPPSGEETALDTVVGGAALADRLRVGHGPEGLERVLRESDVVVLCAPETGETRGLVDAAALGRMKPGAVLINVGRGKVVDEEAMVTALREGRLRGAGLDVYAHEPLAEGHHLWGLPNVLLTPHVSAVTRRFWERETALMVRNLRRYLAGAPLSEWENVVDKHAGY